MLLLWPPKSTLFPYTTLFRSLLHLQQEQHFLHPGPEQLCGRPQAWRRPVRGLRERVGWEDHTSELQSPREAVGGVERGHSGGAGVLERDDADLERRRGAGACE